MFGPSRCTPYRWCCSNACVAVAVAGVAVVVATTATTSMIPCRAMDLINYRTVTLAITK